MERRTMFAQTTGIRRLIIFLNSSRAINKKGDNMAKKKLKEFNVMDHIKTKKDLDDYCEAYAEPYIRALKMATEALKYIDQYPEEHGREKYCDVWYLADYARTQWQGAEYILWKNGVIENEMDD